MGNIVRSFIEEFMPGWASRRAIRRTVEPAAPQEPAGQIHMPVGVAMPTPNSQPRGPYRPQPTPSHWRAPNM